MMEIRQFRVKVENAPYRLMQFHNHIFNVISTILLTLINIQVAYYLLYPQF